MSRIATRFKALQAAHRKGLIPFITAGDPDPALTVALMQQLVAAGADLIELGVPFSDPMADGPVIQRASERALHHKVNLKRVLQLVTEFRQYDNTTPVILMGYLNPIESMGYADFATAAAAAGVDGVLTVDLPPEEGGEFAAILRAAGLDLIYLIAPTTDDQRLASICAMASGFVYYVSVKGITGSGALDPAQVAERVAAIRSVTDLPVGVGFGIKDGASAAAIAVTADAAVVGSALVSRIEAAGGEPERCLAVVGAFIAELRQALDSI